MRRGVRFGIDVGKARIGVSRSDRDGLLATPVETVSRDTAGGDTDLVRILTLGAEYEVTEYIVGHPLALSGSATASTADAVGFAEALAERSEMPVRLVDERLSTVSAHAALRQSGRTTRTTRPVIDQVAAVIVLQHALDSERSSGHAPGTLVEPHERQ